MPRCASSAELPPDPQSPLRALFPRIYRCRRQRAPGQPRPIPAGGDILILRTRTHHEADTVGEVASERIVAVRIVFDRPDPDRIHPYRSIPARAPMHHVVRIPEMTIADQRIPPVPIARKYGVILRPCTGIGALERLESAQGPAPLVFRRIAPELTADRQQIHPTIPEHPLKAIERQMTNQLPLRGRKFPARIFPDIRPVTDIREKFPAVIPELNLRTVLVITAVRPDSAKRPGSLVLHGCPADLLRKHARGFSQRKYIPLQQCPAKNIPGDENPVVAGVTRTEFRGGYNFGTFGGVYTPALLTILGLVMYMRTNFVLGSAGFVNTLIILCVGASISLATTLSIAAIATNTEMRGGGAYYLISRVLGPSFGTSIGLTLFVSQSLAIPFNILGASESLVTQWPTLRPYFPILNLSLGAILAFFVWQGADWAIRVQYVIMAVLGVSVLVFLLGPICNFRYRLLPRISGPQTGYLQ